MSSLIFKPVYNPTKSSVGSKASKTFGVARDNDGLTIPTPRRPKVNILESFVPTLAPAGDMAYATISSIVHRFVSFSRDLIAVHVVLDAPVERSFDSFISDTLVSARPIAFSTHNARAFLELAGDRFTNFDEYVHDVHLVDSFWDLGTYEPRHVLEIVSTDLFDVHFRTLVVDSAHERVFRSSREVVPLYRPPPFPRSRFREEVERLVECLDGDEIYQNAGTSVASSVISSLYGLITGTRESLPKEFKESYDQSKLSLAQHGMTALDAFRWCLRNWKNLRTSPIFTHVHNVLGIAIALGYAPEEWNVLSLGSVKIFQLTSTDKYTDAFSVIDGIVNATEYFVEAAVASWEVGNFLPFFLERHVAAHMDETFEELQILVPRVLNGDFTHEGGHFGPVMLKIDQCYNAFCGARDVATPRSLQRKILQDRCLELRRMQFELASCVRAGDVVAQAYCNIIVGAPRTGKTGFTKDLFRINAAVNNMPFSDELIANMTPGDEYHSQVKNHTAFLWYDDIAAAKPNYDKAMGVVSIIQSVNNARFVAVKAEAELKGRVMPEIRAVLGTTNVEHMNSHIFSNTPAALEQRYFLTRIRTLPQWSVDGGAIDKVKVKHSCQDYVTYGGIKYKDVSRFDICSSTGKGFDPILLKDPSTGRAICLQNLDVAQCYKWHEHLMRLHVEEQKAHVNRLRAVDFNLCSECAQISCVCTPKFFNPEVIPYNIQNRLSLPRILENDVVEDDAEDMDAEPDTGEETVQGVFTAAVAAGTHAAIDRAFSRHIVFWNDKFAGASNPLWWERTSNLFANELFAYVAAEPVSHWWWWIPDNIWNTSACARFANMMQDHEIRDEIRATYVQTSSYAAQFFVCQILLILCGLTWEWSLLSAVYHCTRIARLGAKSRYLKEEGYAVLCRKRNLMKTIQDVNFSGMSQKYKVLLGAVSLATAAAASYVGYKYLADELFGTSDVVNDGEQDINSTFSNYVSKPPPDSDTVSDACDSVTTQASGIPPGISVPEVCSVVPSEIHQGFMSVTSEEVDKKQAQRDVWKRLSVEKRATYKPIVGMTQKQFATTALRGSVAIMRLREDETWAYHCDMYYYDTHRCVMSAGDVPKEVTKWLLIAGPDKHDRREVTVSPCDFQPLPGGKLSLGKVNFRSFKSLRRYFNDVPTCLQAYYVRRFGNGEISTPIPVSGTKVITETGHHVIKWQFPQTTEMGMCGGIYVSRGKHPCIVGVHYACVTQDMSIGKSFCPTSDNFRDFDQSILAAPENLLPLSLPDTFSVKINGKTLLTPCNPKPGNIIDQTQWLGENNPKYPDVPDIEPEPSAKIGSDKKFETSDLDSIAYSISDISSISPFVVFSEEDYKIGVKKAEEPETVQGAEFLGSYGSGAFFKSKVVDTVIAETVKELFPETKRFGPPRFGRSMWPKGSAHAIASSPGLPREHLRWAVDDYLHPFKNNKLPSTILRYLRPLTWEETINGIPGVRFIDPLNKSTSMGAGFPGGKRAWMFSYLDSLGEEKQAFLDDVWERVFEAYEKFARGERVPFLFVAVPKDEPTAVDKDKVRLFMVGEIASILIARRYYTPVIRAMQMLPAYSECCVGINATSPDWESVWSRMEKFDLFFDGDHSKYDLRKNSQIGEASYRIMIEIASIGDYTARDLYLMECVASEFLLPICAYAGDILLLEGSTPSGINVTVNVNGSDNSLMNRCGYKFVYPDAEVGEFREYVKHGNYGDDFLNAVSSERQLFNFINLQSYLGTFGLVITPGLKEAEGKPFVPDVKDLVFLQRTSSKLPELPYRIGALGENSILKSLMSVLKGKGEWDPHEAAATNIDNALREWVYHGQEVYENRQTLMDQILVQHNMRHLSRLIDKPYLDLLLDLQSDYL